MLKKWLSVLIPILAIVAAGFWIYRSQFAADKLDLGPYEALGAVTAQETAKLVGEKAQITLIAPDTSGFPNPPVDAQLKAFQHTLREAGFAVATMVRFELGPQERMASGGAVPVDQFLKVVQSQEAAAVVLFCAFPQLTVPQRDVVKGSGKKFVVISGYLPGYRQLFEAGVLHRAIVPRNEAGPSNARSPETLREAFDAQFEVITPENGVRR